MTTTLKTRHAVEEWDNQLWIRITDRVSKAAGLTQGVPITLEIVEGGVLVRVAAEPQLTLAQRLELFDSEIHGGEAMVSNRTGSERF